MAQDGLELVRQSPRCTDQSKIWAQCEAGEAYESQLREKMRFVLSAFLIMFCSSTLIAEQILYCATEQNMATGFIKEENKWRTAPFQEIRFTVKFPKNGNPNY